ncbi:MAG: hypothetical protein ACI8UX_002493 [Psychromonas sp.]|jgi:hypothetical protein
MYNDQPVTCPNCSSRTEILLDFSHTSEQTQVHQCLTEDCKKEFVTQKDNE